MAKNDFNGLSFIVRLIFALLLVYGSYNPSGYSFYHWVKEALLGDSLKLTPFFAMSAIILIIGWTIYIRATLRSLGSFGLILAFSFFSIIIWWLVDIGLLGTDDISIMTYITLFLLASILATGMSWSHIRRKMSGQIDVDELND